MTQSKPTTCKGRKKKERTRKFERPGHGEKNERCNILATSYTMTATEESLM